MEASAPMTWDLGLGIAASIFGILVMMRSVSIPLKRIVLPLTLLIFHVTGFLIFVRADDAPPLPRWAVAVLLALNAAWVWHTTRYCESCGRTVQVPFASKAPARCDRCTTG